MSKNRWVVMGWLAAAALPVLAQNTKPEPARPAASSASAADMERAQRAASSPMRVILEAGKIRRRVPEGEAAVAPPEAPAARRAAVRPPPPVAAERSAPATRTRVEPTPVARSVGSLDAAPVPETLPVAVTPAASAANAPDPAAADRPADPGPATATAAPIPEPAAGLPVSEAALSLSAAAVAKPQPTAPPPIAQPRLVSMVEPEIPSRVLDQIGRLAEVLVELVIRRDGSVSSVKMLPPAPRQVQRFVVEAVGRWRFEPLPEERVHRVQLVFNSAR